MQDRTGAGLDRQLVEIAVEREAAAADAVGIAAGDGIITDQLFPCLKALHAEQDIAHLSLAVGHIDLGQRTAARREFDGHAMIVAQGDEIDRAVLPGAEQRLGHGRRRRGRTCRTDKQQGGHLLHWNLNST